MSDVILTKDEMEATLNKVLRVPHSQFVKGDFALLGANVEGGFNTYISSVCMIDVSDKVTIGADCMIGHGTQIYTHDHFHDGRKPLLKVQKEKGVKHSPLVIGNDVWLHGCMVLNQVTMIPDGVVVGAGAVLTKNPGPYEICAGNPAKKIGERKDVD